MIFRAFYVCSYFPTNALIFSLLYTFTGQHVSTPLGSSSGPSQTPVYHETHTTQHGLHNREQLNQQDQRYTNITHTAPYIREMGREF